jgi:hypothetical protein
LVLALSALFFFPILAPLRVIRIVARILELLFVFPLILTLLPLLGILLFVLLILFGFGSRHCVPPSLVGRSQIANLFR